MRVGRGNCKRGEKCRGEGKSQDDLRPQKRITKELWSDRGENQAINGETPTRQVHVLLDRMDGRENYQPRKCKWDGGSKDCLQDYTAQKPADIMTRKRARCHNQKRQSLFKETWLGELPVSAKC